VLGYSVSWKFNQQTRGDKMEITITYAKRKRQLVLSFGWKWPLVRSKTYRKLGTGAWYPVEIKR